ncbi:MAG: efflux RND transporter periplasmic adaptor subunit [Candidatus Binataceae bacterium]
MKSTIATLTLMALLVMSVAGCESSPANSSDPPLLPHVVVGHPERGVVESTITLPGDLVGYYQAALYGKVTGYLKSVSVDKGDWVKAGQVLAIIEVPELQQRLDQSQASLKIARLTYQRLQSVWKSDPRLVARQDIDIAGAKYQEAKANSDELAALFNYTRIIAPFDGMITERFVDPGALIRAGGQQSASGSMPGGAGATGTASPVLSIARLDKLRIYVYVPQNEVSFIRPGLPATVTVRGFDGARFAGTVVRFAHSLELSTRTMLTEIDLANPNHTLYPGMYANVTLVLQRHPEALRVPASAIGGDQHHEVFVFQNGVLKEIPVETGISNGRYVEIRTGLTGKELIVQNFSNSLQSGEQVSAGILHPASSVAATR